MKKTLAFILAMLMVFSIVPFAFAENETNTSDSDNGDNGDVVVITGDDVNETEEDINETDDDVNETDDEEEEVEDEDEDEVEVEDEEENETEEEEEEVIEDLEEVQEEAGITPDQPVLWGLERAIERISLALTFNKAAKAKKGLVHARERLQEVQLMIARKRLEAAAKAQETYNDIVEDIEENVAELGDGAEEELADELEIENELNNQRMLVEKIQNIRLRLKNLSEEQRNRIRTLVGALNTSSESLKVKVIAKMEKARIKIKAKEGLSDEQVKALEEGLKNITGNEANIKTRIKEIKEKVKGKGQNKVNDEEDEEDEDEEEDGVNETDES